MQGRSISVLVPPGAEDDLAKILRSVRESERIDEYETIRARKDGTQVAVSLTVSSMCGADGVVVAASTIARDITRRVQYRQQLVHLAEHDVLTGIRNRRCFERDLSDQVGRAHRYGEPSALLMIDINGFKQINDAHDHKVGDKVLKAVGVALTGRLRRTDIVARLGGDEFVVLLPYAGADQARATSEALRRVISETSIQLDDGTTLSVSASVGIALIGPETVSDDAVLAEADRSMYQDKGRQA
jgi:diguanylate cyclase (GGDEF)-like protein